MSLKAENIRKLMGWCPNARAREAKRHMGFGNFELNILDRARGESGDQKNLGWFRRASTRTLLVCTVLSLMYFLLFSQLGINPILLLAGFFIALFIVIFHWKAKMQLYTGLVKQPFIDHSNMEKLCAILAFALYPGIVFLYITGREPALQAMFSFFGGFLTYFWFGYLRILHWEKKNRKTIYFDKSCGKWRKSYIVLERNKSLERK